MFIESHAHISHYRFENTFSYLSYDRLSSTYSVVEGNRTTLMSDMQRQGIGAMIEPGTDIESNQRLLDFAETYPGLVFPAVGLHPTRSIAVKWKQRRVLNELSKCSEVVAIGETGLDFHYSRDQQHRARQILWFIYQILLAHRRKLPLILHIRQADRLALFILKLFKPLLHGGVAHCFYGDIVTAEAFIRLGFHLGIGGTLLQNGEAGETLSETVRRIPFEHLLLETDAPYVYPTCEAVPNAKTRKKVRNSPLIIPAVAAKIAELQGVDIGTVEKQTTENTTKVFRLPIANHAYLWPQNRENYTEDDSGALPLKR